MGACKDSVLAEIRRTIPAPPPAAIAQAVIESIGSQMSVTTSTSLAPDNPNRRTLVIVNTHPTSTLHLSFDATAATTSDFPLPPGASLTLCVNNLGEMLTAEVRGIASAGTIEVGVFELDRA